MSVRKVFSFIAAASLFLISFPTVGAGSASAMTAAEEMQVQFVDVAKKVGPAVVSISTEATEKVQMRRRAPGNMPGPGQDELFDRFLEEFFGGQMPQQREFKQRGLGTGVIVDPDGYILTNEHVIHGADKVTVTLPDGREFKGEIKGADLRSDLAIVKIEAKALPVAELGDSDQVQIGQWAIAIGNPFGRIMMPSQPRTTLPPAMSCVITSLAMLIGIAKPIPWPVATIAVFTPMTRPSRFSSGPPELPGLMDASVWMKFS